MSENVIRFNIAGDDRGSLVALESNKNIPFDIKRVYYIFGTKPDVSRGQHAHRNLEQVLICLNGFVKIKLDDGTASQEIYLDKPNEGIYIKDFIWREMSAFSPDCVIMVLASDYYNEDDYIRDYDDFLREVRTVNQYMRTELEDA